MHSLTAVAFYAVCLFFMTLFILPQQTDTLALFACIWLATQFSWLYALDSINVAWFEGMHWHHLFFKSNYLRQCYIICFRQWLSLMLPMNLLNLLVLMAFNIDRHLLPLFVLTYAIATVPMHIILLILSQLLRHAASSSLVMILLGFTLLLPFPILSLLTIQRHLLSLSYLPLLEILSAVTLISALWLPLLWSWILKKGFDY